MRTSSACRKKGEPLDFNNLPELPPDALKIADAKDITLKSWGTKAPTLLPEDIHYKAILHLALAPLSIMESASCQTLSVQKTDAWDL